MLATTAAMIEQFNKNNILILEEMGYEVHVIGNWKEGNPISDERLEEFRTWIIEHGGKYFHMPSTRKPTDFKNNIKAYKEVVKLIREYKYEFIHCHTPIGSVIGRLAAHKTHTKVMYTAHGFHFFKGAPLFNWLIFYPVERFLSRWTDMLITINQEDYQRAKKSFHAKRTEYIPGVGIDTRKYIECEGNATDLRVSLGIPEDSFVIISVGEVNKNKNHEVVIRAMAELNDPTIKYVICGRGVSENYLLELCKELKVEKNVFILGYKTNVSEYLKIADVFAFPSKREGLGLAALEAMALGLPLIASSIHGIKDYLEDGVSGLGISPNSVESVRNAIVKMRDDEVLRKECGARNLEKVKKFDVSNSNMIMKKLYSTFE